MISQAVPGIIVGFREGMEAFLIIGIMLRYLDKTNRTHLKAQVNYGLWTGIVGSVVIGLGLWGITVLVGQAEGAISELWGSAASLVALVFISTFIYWMMSHGKSIVGDVQSDVEKTLTAGGLFGLAAVMVLREGAEIALFGFTALDGRIYLAGIVFGVLVAAVLAILINRSLIRVNLSVLFNVTLVYLILQAAYMVGYSVHELLEALEHLHVVAESSLLMAKLFNLSSTLLDHKTGAIGVPLNILFGWYSSPEILQFILQHLYIAGVFLSWGFIRKKQAV